MISAINISREMHRNKIKICHVVSSLDTGGMENGVINILNGLDRDQFDPVIICVKARGDMANRLREDIKLINMASPEGKQPFRFTQLGKIFSEEQVSIVHTHGWGGCAFDGVLGAKWGGVPLVLNGEHGTFFLRPRQVFIQKLLYGMFCDANLSVSKSLKKWVTKNLGIPPGKITTISNGVNSDQFHGKYGLSDINNISGLRLDDGHSSKRLILGNIGSLKPNKNQALLLHAVGKIKNKYPETEIQVLMIGQGPDREKLEQQAKGLGIEKMVHFLGLREDVPQILSIIDLLVIVSPSEGMSNVTLEAFASEVPIMTTSTGMKEIVQNGKTGFVLKGNTVEELADCIFTVYASGRERLKSMGQDARKYVLAHHSIGRMVQNYETLYLKLWEENRRN